MAKPSTLPMGRADPHIMQSRGAENYIMNFYCTNYSTSFTKPSIEFNKGRQTDIPAFTGGPVFEPRSAPLYHCSGFTTNMRPQIYYRKTLDQLDNVEMGRMLEDNYVSTHMAHFQPLKLNDGWEDLPVQVSNQESAFTKNDKIHIPRDADVKNYYIDTRIRAPFDILPKHVCALDKIREKNPLKNENYGYGPKFMSTEYKAKYEKPKIPEIDQSRVKVGPKEPSGYVENQEIEDAVTFAPGERWLFNDKRPTGTTTYKDKFLPYVFTKSDTQLPNISTLPLTKESIYSKTSKPSDINPKGDPNEKNLSEYKDNYVGKQKLDPTLAEKLCTAVVGRKEETGQTRNEQGYIQHADDPRRFITNYQMRHFDMNPKGKDREGYVCGGITGTLENAYTIDKTHNVGSVNTAADLRSMDSYQARSIRARDPYYDDHTQDHKLAMKDAVVILKDNYN